jgi:hypothetical protein
MIIYMKLHLITCFLLLLHDIYVVDYINYYTTNYMTLYIQLHALLHGFMSITWVSACVRSVLLQLLAWLHSTPNHPSCHSFSASPPPPSLPPSFNH